MINLYRGFTLLLFSVLCWTTVCGQETKINKSYVAKTSILVRPYDPVTAQIDTHRSFLLNDGIKFYVYKVLDSGYIISVWDFKQQIQSKTKMDKKAYFNGITDDKIDKELQNNSDYYKMSKNQANLTLDPKADTNSPLKKYDHLAYLDYWANNMQFFIPLKDFNDNCEPIYPSSTSFTWGILTLPVKMRFGIKGAPFTFEEKVNFGLTFGAKFQNVSTTYSAHNLLAGISVSNVKIDDSTSGSALSFSTGYMFQYDKFQAGAFFGLDFVGDTQRSKFLYQNRPWLGFAIGLSLFGENKTTADKNQQQSN